MPWVLLWIGLGLFAISVAALCGRYLWQQAKALLNEVDAAAARLEQAQRPPELVQVEPEKPAIFSDPRQLRMARVAQRRRAGAGSASKRRTMGPERSS